MSSVSSAFDLEGLVHLEQRFISPISAYLVILKYHLVFLMQGIQMDMHTDGFMDSSKVVRLAEKRAISYGKK